MCGMLISASRPRRPEHAYMDILKKVTRSILRRHTSRWETTFRGVTTNLGGLVMRRPSWVDWFNNRRLLEVIGNRPPAEAVAAYHHQREHTALAA